MENTRTKKAQRLYSTTLNVYEFVDRFSLSFSLINGNVCDITLSITVHPNAMPTQTIFVCRIKTLAKPMKYTNIESLTKSSAFSSILFKK